MKKNFWASWQGSFFTGLAVVLPGVISIAVLVWLFGTVSNITDTLLFFLPKKLTHRSNGEGPIYWYWSLVALTIAVALITAVGRLAGNYLGQKLIDLADFALLRIPLLNKIYGTIKQLNEAFGSGSKSSFKQVVLVEFPRPGQHSVGFVTGESQAGFGLKSPENIISVFIPTTPNPTAGFLILVPESSVTKLDMSVADGLKFIVSLGAISPDSNSSGPTDGKASPATAKRNQPTLL